MPASPHLLVFRTASPLDRPRLRSFAASLRKLVAGGRPFCCLLTGDEELQQLNRDFLGKDYATDVLSFPSGQPEGSLGDLAISEDRAREQAARLGHSLSDEIGILMLHGLLHLQGMDHATDRGRMRRTEAALRKQLQLPAGLIERSMR
ncbi:MAG: rRNA maturation RNase YbeY [Acidobacteriia bacterium]|nr:rRNA maturation RNase YbeY [Terriglobia bacterium]